MKVELSGTHTARRILVCSVEYCFVLNNGFKTFINTVPFFLGQRMSPEGYIIQET